jgi:hypothetical protein
MHITPTFIGTEKGNAKYLFFFLTDDMSYFILEQIFHNYEKAFEKFARKLGNDGTLVKAFEGDEASTLDQVLNKGWTIEQKHSLRDKLPCLFVIDKDFDDFNPEEDRYLLIALVDQESRLPEPFIEILTLLTESSRTDKLFEEIGKSLVEIRKRGLIDKFYGLFTISFGIIELNAKEVSDFLRACLKSD